MTDEQLAELKNFRLAEPVVSVSDLEDRTPRTLLYGYTCDRFTFHTYLGTDDLLHRVIYTSDRRVISEIHGQQLQSYLCRPDKRVYPNASDYQFCRLLLEKGETFSFTSPSVRTSNNGWFGLRLEELRVDEFDSQ